MAKSKTPKPEFFEAVPNSAPANPDVWSQLGQQLQSSAQTFGNWVLEALREAGPVLRQTAVGFQETIGAGFYRGRYATGWTTKRLLGRKAWSNYFKLAVIGGGVSGIVLVVVATQTLAIYSSDLSNPSAIINNKNTGTTILDRNGEVLYKVYGAANRVTLPLDQMPKALKDATLAAEDPDFYNHAGFSWRGTARAVYQDILNRGKVEGGSTISQQLIKSSLLSPEKSFSRKYREVLLSIALERKYSKDQVLEMYLNQIYYGQGAHGAATAAQVYFHKSVDQLTLGEAAMIAGLPMGPSRLDPNFDHQAALDRRNDVLDRMVHHNLISPTQAALAKTEPLVAHQQNIQINAPHFVFYVLGQLRDRYGSDLVENGGITVTTTLDLRKQRLAEQIAQAQIAKLRYNHVSNAALVSIDPKTGEILTMMGSVDYDQPEWGNVNATISELQPGSSFKPIAYVTAFSKGWHGATTVEDKPMAFPNGNQAPYAPVNYDGKFRGTVTLRRALANSLNVPAVQVLKYAGIDATIEMAHRLGITSLNDRDRYGLSLVLGGGEVRPLDLATTYSTFAAAGIKHEPRTILKVQDRTGKDATKKETGITGSQVIDSRLAYMITNILSDNGARAEEFGANSPLKLSRPAAAKTGTTNDFRDNWTAGYTPNLATVVWVGNNDHSPMNGVNGITGAAPIWHDYMEQALAGLPVQQFSQPSGVVVAKVCSSNGGLTGTGSGYDEVFLAENQQTKRCRVPKTEEKKPEETAALPKEDKKLNEDQTIEPDPIDPGPDPTPLPRTRPRT